MAKVNLNPVFEGFSKKIGSLVFYSRHGEPCVRKAPLMPDRKTEKQIAMRNLFSCVVDVWKGSDGIVQRSWSEGSRKRNQTGYNLFLGTNVKNARQGQAPELSREFGEKPLAALAASASSPAGQAQCSFTFPNGATGKHVAFFVHEKLNGGSEVLVTRHDAGASPASPYVISGLVSGKTYTIHGVVTDKAYAEAETVSASLCCEHTVM